MVRETHLSPGDFIYPLFIRHGQDYVGTMFGFYFLKTPEAAIADYASAKQYADTERYARFFHAMLEQGVYFAPSQFEAGFMSSVHTADDIRATLAAIKNTFGQLISN